MWDYSRAGPNRKKNYPIRPSSAPHGDDDGNDDDGDDDDNDNDDDGGDLTYFSICQEKLSGDILS